MTILAAIAAIALIMDQTASTTPADLPADVVKLEETIDGCIHFGGEPSGDPQRAAFIERNVRKLCGEARRSLPRLKRKYSAEPAVLAKLAELQARLHD